MPITLTVNNIPFSYPVPGDSPGWGQGATGWATEVTTVLNDLLSPDDIIQTSFALSNNVSSFTNIAGLSFNTGTVRSALIEYSIYRTYVVSSTPFDLAEAGQMLVVYQSLASPGSKWQMVIGPQVGSSGVTFTINDAGQIQYKSNNLNAAPYNGTGATTGVIHFRAKTLNQ